MGTRQTVLQRWGFVTLYLESVELNPNISLMLTSSPWQRLKMPMLMILIPTRECACGKFHDSPNSCEVVEINRQTDIETVQKERMVGSTSWVLEIGWQRWGTGVRTSYWSRHLHSWRWRAGCCPVWRRGSLHFSHWQRKGLVSTNTGTCWGQQSAPHSWSQ